MNQTKPTYEELETRVKLLEEALDPFVCNCGRHCAHLSKVETCLRKRAGDLLRNQKN